MNRLKRARRPLRAQLTRSINECTAIIESEDPDLMALQVKLSVMQTIVESIREYDDRIRDAMLDAEVDEAVEDEEFQDVDRYEMSYLIMKMKIEKLISPAPVVAESVHGSASQLNAAEGDRKEHQLPKMKLKELKGEHKSLLRTVPESALPPTEGADWNRAEVKGNMFTAYDDFFKDRVAEEIIEEIPDDGLTGSHYLSHKAVVKEESTTAKIRPVFDASCKSGRAPSWNDCLEIGPKLIDLIPSVMMRFRKEDIGIISDIRKAFLMIEILEEEDRDFLRFLWWEDASCKKMKIYRHRRVAFQVNSSPLLLEAVIFRGWDGNPISAQLPQEEARVVPLIKSTNPRLELMGCLIGARLTSAVYLSMDRENMPSYFWSDSSTALSWIRRNDDWRTFVGNRVHEILSLTDAQHWRHVPGNLNPADLPSRGCTASELLESRWWEGTDWLKESQFQWPGEIPELDEVELTRERKVTIVGQTVLIESSWFLDGCAEYIQMLRRASYVFLFLDAVMKKTVFSGEITVPKLDTVEKRLVQVVQSGSVGGSDEIGKSFKTLGVFRDEAGSLRLKTKSLMRKDSADFRTLMLLPTSHPFVKDLIMGMDVRNCHAGVQVLISRIREMFWIVHSRKTINKVIKTCQRCKKFNAENVEMEAAVLPEDKVRDAATFEIVGVDIAGLLFLRNQKKSLRRFIARRKRPEIIDVDTGTNFRGAANLFKALDWEKIQRRSALEPIQWKFAPPSAPWWVIDHRLLVDGEDQMALTPIMFFQWIGEAGVPEMDKIDIDGLNRRFRYNQLVDQRRSCFRKWFQRRFARWARETTFQRSFERKAREKSLPRSFERKAREMSLQRDPGRRGRDSPMQRSPEGWAGEFEDDPGGSVTTKECLSCPEPQDGSNPPLVLF